MASAFKRGQTFYAKWKDATGRWQNRATQARTLTEARRIADDLERQAERQRLGLEYRPPADGGGTFATLMEWWLATYSRGSPSHDRNEPVVRKHLLDSALAPLPLVAVTAAKLEEFLHAKGQEELSPQSVNHLRGFISRAFNAARRTGRYAGPNPAAAVRRRRVPRRLPTYLRAEEVPVLLRALDPRWRPLFAIAIYTGLRKGELAGLKKSDVDLSSRLLTVARSYDRDTTKGGHADVIPISAEAVPYLEAAISSSPSDFVFPQPNGEMMRQDTGLEHVLRRALGRAGLVTSYQHVCRRKGCSHQEKAPDAELRRCPTDGRKLWPKPQVRPIRFHDLRHTTASLLMMSGANPAAVQRIMRHSDPKLTTEVYGHLAPEYLRAEVDRLSFGAPPPLPTRPAGAPREGGVVQSSPFGARVVQDGETSKEEAEPPGDSPRISAPSTARQAGLEPTTPGLEGRCSIQLSYWRPSDCGKTIGARGFEPPTPCAQGRCATRLRYAPKSPAFFAHKTPGRKDT